MTRDQIDAVLADFRAWLEQLAEAPIPPGADFTPAAPDLHTLLGQVAALRHEVNLQTRSSRTQQEQAADALRQLNEALEMLQRKQDEATGQEETHDEEMLRPLLKTLVDIYDALALARREIQRVREITLPELERLKELPGQLLEKTAAPAPVAPAPPEPSIWGRLFGQKPAAPLQPAPDLVWREHMVKDQQELATSVGHAVGRIGPMLTALLTGYTMGMQRVERALQQYELEPIAAVGQPFDPEQMEVVEVVAEPGRVATEVIDEVRRGYLWHGRVFRFAQVRVARPEVG